MRTLFRAIAILEAGVDSAVDHVLHGLHLWIHPAVDGAHRVNNLQIEPLRFSQAQWASKRQGSVRSGGSMQSGQQERCARVWDRQARTTGACPASSFMPSLETLDAPAPLSSSRSSVTSLGMS